jgi:ABC-type lipoprotein export system ATPase subunit
MTSLKKVLLQANKLRKTFRQGNNVVTILDEANFELRENEVVALIGPSGCGKTTFLQILGLLDEPTSGEIIIYGENLMKKRDSEKAKYRRNNIGFVYQAHNLLGDFTAFENIKMPLLIKNGDRKEDDDHVFSMLSMLGIEHRRNNFPSQLSGGEQQRVAIARSLVHNPLLILADEPTGNLDSDNADNVISLLFSVVKKHKKSLLIVTHNPEIAKKADRVITIEKGKVVGRKKI